MSFLNKAGEEKRFRLCCLKNNKVKQSGVLHFAETQLSYSRGRKTVNLIFNFQKANSLKIKVKIPTTYVDIFRITQSSQLLWIKVWLTYNRKGRRKQIIELKVVFCSLIQRLVALWNLLQDSGYFKFAIIFTRDDPLKVLIQNLLWRKALQ